MNFHLIFSFILCLSHNIKQYFIDFAGFDSPREYQKKIILKVLAFRIIFYYS